MALQDIVLLLGGPAGLVAIFKYLEKNAEMKVLAEQAQKTLTAKATEIEEVKRERDQWRDRYERLLVRITEDPQDGP